MPPPVITSPESSRTNSPFQRPPSVKDEDALPRRTNEVSKAAKKSSLERRSGGLAKVPSLRKRTASQDNLLEKDDEDDDHDYAEIIINNAAQHEASASGATKYKDSEIYGNLPYAKKLGSVDNAGARWESYWKTDTLLRAQNQDQTSTGNGSKTVSSTRK